MAVCLKGIICLRVQDAPGLSLVLRSNEILWPSRCSLCLRLAGAWLPISCAASSLLSCCVTSRGRGMKHSTNTIIAHLVQQKSSVKSVSSPWPSCTGKRSSASGLMVQVFKPFQNTTNVLCAHRAPMCCVPIGPVILKPLIRILVLVSTQELDLKGIAVVPRVRSRFWQRDSTWTSPLGCILPAKKVKFNLACVSDQ